MAINKQDLEKFTLQQLKDFAEGEGIEFNPKTTKADLLQLLIDHYANKYDEPIDDEDDDTEEDDDDEDDDKDDKKKKKKKKKSLSSFYDDDDEEAKTKNLLFLLLNVRATIVQLRKRILGEQFDKKKGRYVQMRNKVPLVSKQLAGEMEGLIISICNPQLYLSSSDKDEFRLTMRRNLKDFNNKLLNEFDVKTVQKHNDILNIFWNLISTNLKIAYGGEFKLFFQQLEIGQFKETQDNQNPPKQGYLKQAGEYLTS